MIVFESLHSDDLDFIEWALDSVPLKTVNQERRNERLKQEMKDAEKS